MSAGLDSSRPGSSATDASRGAPERRLHRVLLFVPFVWQAALAPVVNDVAWRPWGLPFPMAWQMAGVVLTTLVIGAVYAIDRRIDTRLATQSEDRTGSGPMEPGA
jgi:hypothetical protein